MYLDSLRTKVYEIHKQLSQISPIVDPTVIKEIIQNKKEASKMFFALFEEHNQQMEKLLNIEYERSTLGCYNTYVGQTVYNFDYNVLLPIEDEVLRQLIVEYNRTNKTHSDENSYDLIQQIMERIEQVGGTTLLWA